MTNPFLESFKADRWKEGYFWYKPEGERETTKSFYSSSVNETDETAFKRVEDVLEHFVNFDYVVGVNVQTNLMEYHGKFHKIQTIRFDMTKDHPDRPMPQGVIS
jgi:hypothetical protein